MAVSNLGRSIEFYNSVVGLNILSQQGNLARLGANGVVLLELQEQPGLHPIAKKTRLGLYHTAFLLPHRQALGSFLQYLNRRQIPFGAGDHLYSEALYLADPDGLTVEVYADRPRDTWTYRNGELMSATDPVDLVGLARSGTPDWYGVPAETRVGHVHFYIGDLRQAKRFYHESLGFTIMTWNYPGALFTSVGGYHHQLGLNNWAAGSPIASPYEARLLYWELELPNRTAMADAFQSLQRGDWNPQKVSDEIATCTDPCGISVRLIAK
ncbi:VOC family protein [Edaphobacter bradus]|uniref:VOC family protein n=1 Tax=Edaphobacter bradus TaxID=2259016 RepID=UPI0021E01977|nr:VOC family protein [Edaphobacter bradus]